MIEIDGSFGEGGGQVLRTALSLSCLTGKAFRIFNIRKKRAKPGLMPQHLMAVKSAAHVARAELTGDTQGSVELTFNPGKVSPGKFSFDIGTAGATSLVLQTLLPPLLRAGGSSDLSVTGGTHVPFSPSWNYLTDVFAPTLARLGPRLQFRCKRPGFYPKGGGEVHCHVENISGFKPLTVERRGELLRVSGVCVVANLARSIAEREQAAAIRHLRASLGAETHVAIGIREEAAFSPGTYIFLKGEYENAVAGFTVLGERGKPAEAVGEEAAKELLLHHGKAMPIDPHLSDQLVPYLAQAEGSSFYATSCITNHLQTNLHVTALFLDFAAEIKGETHEPGTVRITPGKAAFPL